jgi:DNA-binding transcriptional ArsR family regulator
VLEPTNNARIDNDDVLNLSLGSAGHRRPGADARDGSARERAVRAAADALAAAGGGSRNADEADSDTVVLCRLLTLLADKTRLRILWLLADGERAVGAMTSELRLPQPTVSHHLAWLRTMHLVSPRRAGKNVFYALGRFARTESEGSLSLVTGDTVVTIARGPNR